MLDAASCRQKADRFRELAEGADERTAADLMRLAGEYDAEAVRLEPDGGPPMPEEG